MASHRARSGKSEGVRKVRFSRFLFTIAGAALAFTALVTSAIASPITITSSTVGGVYGGFEDNAGSGSDYDYNDMVFNLSVSGSSVLAVNTAGTWNSPTGLALTGPAYPDFPSAGPFWNNGSQDGPDSNIGYCIYNLTDCHGTPTTSGVSSALDPNADYLTAPGNLGSANDVYFTLGSGSSANLTLVAGLTAWDDNLYYAFYNPSTGAVGAVEACGGIAGYAGVIAGSTCNITSTSLLTSQGGSTLADLSFILIGQSGGGFIFYSDMGASNSTSSGFGQTIDSTNVDGLNPNGTDHFAFFATSVPEPSSLFLLGSGLACLAWFGKRKSVCAKG